jgi:hypothetical protein
MKINYTMRIIFIMLLSLTLAACSKENTKVTSNKQDSVKPTDSKKDTIPQTDASKNNAFIVSKIKDVLVNNVYKSEIGLIPKENRKFYFSAVDINSDGFNEYFVAFSNSYFCGSGGCTVVLLNSEFKPKQTFTVVSYPIIVLNTKTKGWNDLVMHSGGKDHILKHIKENYPSNPSVMPEYTDAIGNDCIKLFDDIESSASYEF